MKQEDQDQQPRMPKENTPVVAKGSTGTSDAEKAGRTPCVTERSYDTDTCIGGDIRSNTEEAGSVPSVDSRQCYESTEEKQKFIRESFKLDSNAILNADAKLKEDVIKLFLDNFEVLAMHLNQYGETDVLEMKIDLIPGAVPYKSRVRPLNPDQGGNLRDQLDKWMDQGEIEENIMIISICNFIY